MNRKSVCIKFKDQLLDLYEKQGIRVAFLAYLGFIIEHALDDRYKHFTKWQIEDMLMALENEKIDSETETLETAYNYNRRGGKSRKLTVLEVFGQLIDKLCIWRTPYSAQLEQAGSWFWMNPFVRKVQIRTNNRVQVYNSPDLDIGVLSPGKIASKEADWLFFDEMGWCFKHLKLYEYYKNAIPMIAASKFRHITNASTPALYSAFHETWEQIGEIEVERNTTLRSTKTWRDCPWITSEFVEMERKKNNDCPWYVDQNYEALFVVYGGSVFSDIITLGDRSYVDEDGKLLFPSDFFERYRLHTGEYDSTHAGVDFNGDQVGHYIVDIRYNNQYIYVLNERVFKDLGFFDKLPLWNVNTPSLSLEVEDGQFNIPFCNSCRRLGIPAIYKEFDEYIKAERVAQLKARTIIIDPKTCPVTYKNLREAAYDQNSRLPKLEKRTDQHGLDALIHAMHESGQKIHVRDKTKRGLFGRETRVNPITYI